MKNENLGNNFTEHRIDSFENQQKSQVRGYHTAQQGLLYLDICNLKIFKQCDWDLEGSFQSN